MFCCALLCVHSSLPIISMGKRELVPLLCLSSWCLVIVVCLAMPRVYLQFVIVVFPDHTHLLFFIILLSNDIIRCPKITRYFVTYRICAQLHLMKAHDGPSPYIYAVYFVYASWLKENIREDRMHVIQSQGCSHLKCPALVKHICGSTLNYMYDD